MLLIHDKPEPQAEYEPFEVKKDIEESVLKAIQKLVDEGVIEWKQ